MWRPVFSVYVLSVLPRGEIIAAAGQYLLGLRWVAVHWALALLLWGLAFPWLTGQIYRLSIHFSSFQHSLTSVFRIRLSSWHYVAQDVLCGVVVICFLFCAASINGALGDFIRRETESVSRTLRMRARERRLAILRIAKQKHSSRAKSYRSRRASIPRLLGSSDGLSKAPKLSVWGWLLTAECYYLLSY